MAKQARRDEIKGLIEGKTIEVVEDGLGSSSTEGDYLVIHLAGLKLYVDAPTLYSDDSGDVPAAF